MYYPDGMSPPPEVIVRWNKLLAEVFDDASKDDKPCIAIHCVAGLGRYEIILVFVSQRFVRVLKNARILYKAIADR
jgi:ligand-binding sensor protein